MELREAAQRILWHYKLLALGLAIGLLIPWALNRQADPNYAATMRVLVSGNSGDAAVSADTVAAIATSRSQLGGALADAHAQRGLDSFAKGVSVRAVGSSGMVDLTVVDHDPLVAVAVANFLTGRVSFVMQSAGLAKAPLPKVIDSADAASVEEIPTRRKQDIAFGGLLGLVMAVVIAALFEAFNPTVIGERAIAIELRAPVLGVLPSVETTLTSRELPWVRYQLGAQAERSGVATVELTSAGPTLDLAPLTLALHESAAVPRRRPRSSRAKRSMATGTEVVTMTNGNGNEGSPGATQTKELQIRVLDRTDRSSFHANGSAGIVVVTPTVVKRADMDAARDLLGLTGWPAVGVIAYRRSRIARGLERLKAGPDPSSTPSRIRRLLPWPRNS